MCGAIRRSTTRHSPLVRCLGAVRARNLARFTLRTPPNDNTYELSVSHLHIDAEEEIPHKSRAEGIAKAEEICPRGRGTRYIYVVYHGLSLALDKGRDAKVLPSAGKL